MRQAQAAALCAAAAFARAERHGADVIANVLGAELRPIRPHPRAFEKEGSKRSFASWLITSPWRRSRRPGLKSLGGGAVLRALGCNVAGRFELGSDLPQRTLPLVDGVARELPRATVSGLRSA
jgi:hypothetical protein